MINTRFGSEVEVVGFNKENFTIDVKRKADDKFLEVFYSDLKADGGLEEIQKAIESCNTK